MATVVFHVIEVIAIVLYAILAIVCLVSLYKSFYREESKILSRLFHFFICLFVVIRTIWYIMRVATGEGPITFTLNNTSFLFYISANILVLFYWMEQYHRTYVSTTEFLPRFKLIFIVINVLIYSVQFILFVLFFTVNKQKREGSSVYLTIILYQDLLSLVIAFMFLGTVCRLYLNFSSMDKDIFRNRINHVAKIILLTLIFATCFVIRTIIFLYQPATGKYMNNELFVTMGYFVPDIIPTLCLIRMIHTRMKSEVEDNNYIETLYQNEMDCQDEEQDNSFYQSSYTKIDQDDHLTDNYSSYDSIVVFKSNSVPDKLRNIGLSSSLQGLSSRYNESTPLI